MRSCLSGCFSKPQQIVFTGGMQMNDRKSWPAGKSALMAFPPQMRGSLRTGRLGSIQVRQNRQDNEKGRQHVLSLTATSCGLLKQPDKQECASLLRRSKPRLAFQTR